MRIFTLEMTEQEADAMTEAWGVISALACAEPLLATLFFERFLKADKTLTEKVAKLLHEVAAEKGITIPDFGEPIQTAKKLFVAPEATAKDEQATRDSWAGRLGERLNGDEQA